MPGLYIRKIKLENFKILTMKYFSIIFLMLSILKISGQIVYQQFDPPIQVIVEELDGNESESLNFDLNDDGVNDIQFVLKYWYSFWSPSYDEGFSSRFNTQHQYYLQNDMCNVLPLEVGDTIGSNLNWVDTPGSGTLMYKDGMGCNNFNSFRYIGLKLLLNDNYYFGWIRAHTYYSLSGYEPGSFASLRISDYAVNWEPNQGVIAGDTISSLIFSSINNINSKESCIIYPNPAIKKFEVRSRKFLQRTSYGEVRGTKMIRVYNSQGLKVEELTIPENTEALSVDVEGYQRGLYFLQLLISNKVVGQTKLIVQ